MPLGKIATVPMLWLSAATAPLLSLPPLDLAPFGAYGLSLALLIAAVYSQWRDKQALSAKLDRRDAAHDAMLRETTASIANGAEATRDGSRATRENTEAIRRLGDKIDRLGDRVNGSPKQ